VGHPRHVRVFSIAVHSIQSVFFFLFALHLVLS
jgi:hypothetical protein